jgi:nicotinamidase-related amidase
MTLEVLGERMTDLALDLQRFSPPAWIVDKTLYSPWTGTDLDAILRRSGVDTLVITGAETDVCVLAAVLGAVDLGYRVVVVSDGWERGDPERLAHEMGRLRRGCLFLVRSSWFLVAACGG